MQSCIMLAVSSLQQLACSLDAAVEPVRCKYSCLSIGYRRVGDLCKYEWKLLWSALIEDLEKGSSEQQQLCVLKQINQAEWLSIVDGNELYYQACFGGMFVELTANHFFT